MAVIITMTGTVKIKGGEKFKLFLERIASQKAKLEVGFFPRSKYEDGTQVATVAVGNEFGHVNKNGSIVPPRPFLHTTYEENRKKWVRILKMIVNKQGENIDVKSALEKVGFVAVQAVKEKITWWSQSGEPRNAEATIKAKAKKRYGEKEEDGRDVGDSPLIWNGHMRDSVESSVTNK